MTADRMSACRIARQVLLSPRGCSRLKDCAHAGRRPPRAFAVRPVPGLDGGGRKVRTERSERDDRRDGHAGWPVRRCAPSCSRASMSAGSSSTPTRKAGRATNSRRNPSVALLFSLEVAAAADPDRGNGRARHRCRGRCLLRVPAADFPPGCLGLPAVAAAGEPGGSGRAAGGDGTALPGRRFPGRTIGPAIGCCRKGLNSGRICRIVCMTGRFTAGRRTGAGSRANCSPSLACRCTSNVLATATQTCIALDARPDRRS